MSTKRLTSRLRSRAWTMRSVPPAKALALEPPFCSSCTASSTDAGFTYLISCKSLSLNSHFSQGQLTARTGESCTQTPGGGEPKMDCDGTQCTDVNPLLSRLTEGFLFSVLTLAFQPQTD